MANATNLTPCGIYRTTLPLEGKEEAVPAGRMVYFHNHSDQENKSMVLLPKEVKDNTWSFQDRGYLVESKSWPSTLVLLPKQGFYVVREEITTASGGRMGAGMLVQLGYNNAGAAILFPGTYEPGNRIQFPDRGLLISDLQMTLLDATSFKLVGPQANGSGDLH